MSRAVYKRSAGHMRPETEYGWSSGTKHKYSVRKSQSGTTINTCNTKKSMSSISF